MPSFVFEWGLVQDVEASKGEHDSSPKVPLRDPGARLPLGLKAALGGVTVCGVLPGRDTMPKALGACCELRTITIPILELRKRWLEGVK